MTADGTLPSVPGQAERSEALRTIPEIAGFFFRSGSGRIVTGAVLLASMARLWLAASGVDTGFGWADLAVVLFVVFFVGPIEWLIHLLLLHAPVDSVRTRWFATSVAHRSHHEDPGALNQIMLLPLFAALFVAAIAVWTVTWSVPLIYLVGRAGGGFSSTATPVSAYLTALAGSWLALAHYEWVHLLVHTRYRPSTRYYKRLARNHRLHHFRNEGYWLGVTSNLGDRMFGTLPKSRSEVPLSETARSLS